MDKMGREAIISIGSNVPDKRERVEKACEELKNRFYSFQVSSIYTTPAVGRLVLGSRLLQCRSPIFDRPMIMKL